MKNRLLFSRNWKECYVASIRFPSMQAMTPLNIDEFHSLAKVMFETPLSLMVKKLSQASNIINSLIVCGGLLLHISVICAFAKNIVYCYLFA